MIYTRHNRYFAVGFDVSEITPEIEKAAVVRVPIYAYVHSGVTVKASTTGNPFTCPWDSAQCGVAIATRNDVLSLCGGKNVTKNKLAEAIAYLIDMVEDWDNYINNVEGYEDLEYMLPIHNEL